jgi:hypothetical protein
VPAEVEHQYVTPSSPSFGGAGRYPVIPAPHAELIEPKIKEHRGPIVRTTGNALPSPSSKPRVIGKKPRNATAYTIY